MDLLCFFCLVFAMPLCASVYCVLWSPAGKGLTSWLSFVVSYCEFVIFPLVSWVRCGLIVSIPDLCTLTYFHIRIIPLKFGQNAASILGGDVL